MHVWLFWLAPLPRLLRRPVSQFSAHTHDCISHRIAPQCCYALVVYLTFLCPPSLSDYAEGLARAIAEGNQHRREGGEIVIMIIILIIIALSKMISSGMETYPGPNDQHLVSVGRRRRRSCQTLNAVPIEKTHIHAIQE